MALRPEAGALIAERPPGLRIILLNEGKLLGQPVEFPLWRAVRPLATAIDFTAYESPARLMRSLAKLAQRNDSPF